VSSTYLAQYQYILIGGRLPFPSCLILCANPQATYTLCPTEKTLVKLSPLQIWLLKIGGSGEIGQNRLAAVRFTRQVGIDANLVRASSLVQDL